MAQLSKTAQLLRDAGGVSRQEKGEVVAIKIDKRRATGAILKLLPSFPKLKELEIIRLNARDDDFAPLGELPVLKKLQIIQCPIAKTAFRAIGNLRQLQKLLLSVEPLQPATNLAPLSNLVDMIELNLCGFDFRKGAAGALGTLKKLRALVLSRLTGADAALAAIAKAHDLETLCLHWEGTSDLTDIGMSSLNGLTKITDLSLAGANFTTKGAEVLRRMSALTQLDLAASSFDDTMMPTLSTSTRLEWLNLYHCPIGSKGLKAIAELRFLSRLGLASTKVDDSGVKHIPLRRLHHLDLTDTTVTDACLEVLAGGRNELMVFLTGSHVTEKGIKAFVKKHPECLGDFDESHASISVYRDDGDHEIDDDASDAVRAEYTSQSDECEDDPAPTDDDAPEGYLSSVTAAAKFEQMFRDAKLKGRKKKTLGEAWSLFKSFCGDPMDVSEGGIIIETSVAAGAATGEFVLTRFWYDVGVGSDTSYVARCSLGFSGTAKLKKATATLEHAMDSTPVLGFFATMEAQPFWPQMMDCGITSIEVYAGPR